MKRKLVSEVFLGYDTHLNRITLSQHKSDENNRMLQLTDLFCVLLR
jgi:hypothetical protein